MNLRDPEVLTKAPLTESEREGLIRRTRWYLEQLSLLPDDTLGIQKARELLVEKLQALESFTLNP